ncbi:MAG: copper homeostasis protein CutC [Planctomycetaceae bacterium]
MKTPDSSAAGSRDLRDGITIELCAGGIDDVRVAAECQIPRIELNCGLPVGGLTPSLGLMSEARRIFHGTIICMLRPREGGFCYSDREFRQMLVDARSLLDMGCDGIAVGILCADGTLDATRCAAIRNGFPDTTLVFHRAFDVVRDPVDTLERLVTIGFYRILTSGRALTALAGSAEIRRYREQAAERIEILPGGGIRAENVREVVSSTGCRQVHTSARYLCRDSSTALNPHLAFGPHGTPSGSHSAVCRDELTRLQAQVAAFPEAATS